MNKEPTVVARTGNDANEAAEMFACLTGRSKPEILDTTVKEYAEHQRDQLNEQVRAQLAKLGYSPGYF